MFCARMQVLLLCRDDDDVVFCMTFFLPAIISHLLLPAYRRWIRCRRTDTISNHYPSVCRRTARPDRSVKTSRIRLSVVDSSDVRWLGTALDAVDAMSEEKIISS